jgi:hypothetical protein
MMKHESAIPKVAFGQKYRQWEKKNENGTLRSLD